VHRQKTDMKDTFAAFVLVEARNELTINTRLLTRNSW
jgi:hypothetical protein